MRGLRCAAQVAAYRERGWSFAEIGRLLGFSRQWASFVYHSRDGAGWRRLERYFR